MGRPKNFGGKKPKPGTSRAAAQAKGAIFVAAMIRHGNQTAAAKEAGYTTGYGHSLANRPEIKARIEAGRAKVIEKIELTENELLSQLKALIHADPADLYDERGNLRHVTDMPSGLRSALTKISHSVTKSTVMKGTDDGAVPDRLVTTETADIHMSRKLDAIVVGMRHMGMFEKDHQPLVENLRLVVIPE